MKKRQNGRSVPGSGNAQRHSGSRSNASVRVSVSPARSACVATRGATCRSILGPGDLRVRALAYEDRARRALAALPDLRVEARHADARGARHGDVPLAVRARHEEADALAAAVGEDAIERHVAPVLAARVLGLHLAVKVEPVALDRDVRGDPHRVRGVRRGERESHRRRDQTSDPSRPVTHLVSSCSARLRTCSHDPARSIQPMQIGKPGEPVSRMSQAYPDRVEVRGRDLTGELMGSLTFTEYFHLLLTGEVPTDDQRFFLDLLLVAIAEHGMMPTNVAARMTLDADPGSLQGAVAAGILGAGPVILGTADECARLLDDGVSGGRSAREIAAEVRAAGGKLPGFGHPLHRPLDPRAERMLELADERGASGPHVELARRLRDAAAEVWGKPLTMNVSMPIAAV